MNADPKCPQCHGLGVVSRCRSGVDCACALVDSGVACTQGFSYKCVACNAHLIEQKGAFINEPAHI